MNVTANQPGDEELEADNNFCKYEKYKGRMAGACPRVDEVVYRVTVYEEPELQKKLRVYLFEALSARKEKSKHSNVALVLGRSWTLCNTDLYEEIYAFHAIKERQLVIDFSIRIIPINGKYLSSVTVFMGSSELSSVAHEISKEMAKEELENYIKGLIDNYLKFYFFKNIFPDKSNKN